MSKASEERQAQAFGQEFVRAYAMPPGPERERAFAAVRKQHLAQQRWAGWKSVLGDIWSCVIGMGMVSSDPVMARQAMVLEAERQLAAQRRIQADREAEREAAADERMRQQAALTAELTAQAMVDKMERRFGQR